MRGCPRRLSEGALLASEFPPWPQPDFATREPRCFSGVSALGHLFFRLFLLGVQKK